VIDDIAAILRPELAELRAYAPGEHAGIATRLDANEAPPPSSPAVRDAILRALSSVAFERYPDARASLLKQRISERTGAKPADLLVGSGSDELISFLVTALARPRDKKTPQVVVLTPAPTFVMYRVTARAHGLKPVEVPLDAAWDLDVGAMKKAFELMRPNLVFIASPNNPTGNRMSDDRLAEICGAARDALVVIDEAYVDYAGPSLRIWRERYPNLGVLRTLSKVGLAALRVGWLEADEGLVREVDKVRQPFNVSATSQTAAAAVLAEAWDAVLAHVAHVVRERERLAAEIGGIAGYSVTPSAANFVWVKTPHAAEATYRALVGHGILVRSFHAAGGRLAHQLRVTVGSRTENDRLLEGLRGCA
jgi:histidinol-phosphate aminotransferase